MGHHHDLQEARSLGSSLAVLQQAHELAPHLLEPRPWSGLDQHADILVAHRVPTVLCVRRDVSGLARSEDPFAFLGRPDADIAADHGERFRHFGVDVAWHARRVSAHIQVGNKFTAI